MARRRNRRLGAAATADQMVLPSTSAPATMLAPAAPKKPWSRGAKVALGVGSLGALGGLAWLIWSRMTYMNTSAKEGAALEALRPPDNSPPSTKEEKLILSLEPALQVKAREFLAKARAAGHRITITQGRRTIAEQNALYNARPRVTKAPGGSSAHNYGMAFDFVFLTPEGRISSPPDAYSYNVKDRPWKELGAIGKSLGLEWGGSWKSFVDLPHFELPGWKNMRAQWKAGKLQVA